MSTHFVNNWNTNTNMNHSGPLCRYFCFTLGIMNLLIESSYFYIETHSMHFITRPRSRRYVDCLQNSWPRKMWSSLRNPFGSGVQWPNPLTQEQHQTHSAEQGPTRVLHAPEHRPSTNQRASPFIWAIMSGDIYSYATLPSPHNACTLQSKVKHDITKAVYRYIWRAKEWPMWPYIPRQLAISDAPPHALSRSLHQNHDAVTLPAMHWCVLLFFLL